MMECEIMNSILTSTVGMLFSSSFSQPESMLAAKSEAESVKSPVKSTEVQDSMQWISANGKKWLEEAMSRLRIDYSKVSGKHLVGKMTEELLAEKNKVKGELKKYDANFALLFRRQPGRVEKEPMRPLYVYYKKLKQALGKAGTASGHTSGGASSIKPVSSTTAQNKSEPISKAVPEKESKGATAAVDKKVTATKTFGEWTFKNNEEIISKIAELKAERTRLRGTLDKFQQEFVRVHNRKIKYNKDIAPVAGDFKRYKELKKIIVKLEELLK